MPARGVERAIVLRRFEGTNILVDSSYLGPGYLRRSQNWVPGVTFRLETRRGSLPYVGGSVGSGVTKVHALLGVQNTNGDELLFAVVSNTTPSDFVVLSVNGGVWSTVAGTTFPSANQTYDMDVMNGNVYVCNGVDPVLQIVVDTLAITTLEAISDFFDTSGGATLAADPGAQLLSGGYSYCWATFDEDQKRWLERSQTRTFQMSTTGDQSVTFPFPVGMSQPVTSTLKPHLFISPVDFPVEFAHDHTPNGVASGTTTIRQIIADGILVPLHGTTRHGTMMRAYRGRMIVAGDRAFPTSVWGSSILSTGNEQAIYDAGVYWPYNARLPRTPEPVTGLGLASAGERESSIDSPLVVCTLSRTYLWYGDVVDDPDAEFVLVSRRAGCISSKTMVETPFGLFYVGLDSVYFIPAGGSVPSDVGWPIRPEIQAIPVGERNLCRGLYHKGFLKLAIVPAGGNVANRQWWLDLRSGLSDTPSWWGPHTGADVQAWTTLPNFTHDDNGEQGLVAIGPSGGLIERMDQLNSFVEGGTTLVNVLQTGELDDGRPFDRKILTRVRVIGFPSATTTLTPALSVDGGLAAALNPLTFLGSSGAQWNISQWNVAQWGQISFTEAQSTTDASRPRGRTFSLQLTHNQKIALALRDIEVVYLPVTRPTRSISTQPNS